MSLLVGKDTSLLLKQVRVPQKQEVKHQMARSTLMQNQGIHHQHIMKKLTAVKFRFKHTPEMLRQTTCECVCVFVCVLSTYSVNTIAFLLSPLDYLDKYHDAWICVTNIDQCV